MQLISRSEWGAKPATSSRKIDLKGPTTIHWNGSGKKWDRIDDDAHLAWGIKQMQVGQNFHMEGRGWSDIAYNFVMDPWGDYLYEGRGFDVRPASQGTTEGNETSHSIMVMTGVGDPALSEGAIAALDEAVALIAVKGTAEDIAMGHRDWKATACPGDGIYGHLSTINDPNYRDPEVTPGLQEPVGMFVVNGGYGVVDANGRVEFQGDVTHKGDLRHEDLVAPVVDAEGTVGGDGYYLCTADGGVFTYGNAPFHGSIGGAPLDRPVVAIEVEPGGYYMVASDGGIFTFGNLPFVGSFVGEVNE